MKRISLWVALAALSTVAACTDTSKYTGPAASASLVGVYSGNVSGVAAAVPYSSGLTLSLSQTGNAVTGTWSTVMGNAGTVSGTVSGASVAFTVVQVTPCAGSVNGTGAVSNNGNTLTGSYAGTMCGQALSANFTVTRP